MKARLRSGDATTVYPANLHVEKYGVWDEKKGGTMSYQKALERYMEATNTHDFGNVQACLDTSAVYWFSDRTCKTLEEIRAYFEHA